MMRLLLIPALLGTMACGGMKDGTYLVLVTEVLDNTCTFEDEELFEIGSATVTVFKDEIYINGNAYDRDGDFFSRSASATVLDLDPCFVQQDKEWDGLILDSTSFTMDVEGDLYTEGDCTAYDTTGIPCSYAVVLDGLL